jgi:histidinol dehydrogenase
VHLTRAGLRRAGPGIVSVARAEGFAAHALSVLARMQADV